MNTLFRLVILLFGAHTILCPPMLHAEDETDNRINITLHPAAKSQLFNAVAILPFTSDGPYQAELLPLLHQQLDKLHKYPLIPFQQSVELIQQQSEKLKRSPSLAERIIWAGKQLQARGIVTGTLQESILPQISKPEKKQVQLAIILWDISTTQPVWEVFITLLPQAEQVVPTFEAISQAIEDATNQLRVALINQGAIYSPRIPQPTVLTTQGNIRSCRVVIQPGAQSQQSAFQLLRASAPEMIFAPVGKPQQSHAAPVVLEDAHLNDATTYWYTVTAVTEQGMASIPMQPFSITTIGKPEPVTAFNATGNGLRQISLSWERATDPNVVGYTIYRKGLDSDEYQKIAEIENPDQQNYVDRGTAKSYERYGKLEDNTRYWYILRTKNKVDVESVDSSPIAAQTKGAPAPPEGLRGISNQPRMVSLYWQEVTDPHTKGYILFRASGENGPFEEIGYIDGRDTKQTIDSGSFQQPLKDNTTYFYKIQAVNVVDVLSSPSSIASATTKPVPQAVQTVPTRQELVKTAHLQWQPNAEGDIKAYEIYRGEQYYDINTKVATTSADRLEYTDTGLADGTSYWYTIRAVDRDNLEGLFSAPVRKTTKPRPAQPEDLRAKLTAEGVMLQWTPNPEQDIAHYTVFSVGFLTKAIQETKKTHYLYKTELNPGQEHRFQIEAVDKDGLISERSKIITIQVPETAPTES